MNRARRLTLSRVLLVVALLFLLILSIIISTSRKRLRPVVEPSATPARLEVVDGDTFIGADGRKVRLLGIDAPEKEQPYYREATERLEELIINNNNRLALRFGSKRTDRYDRLLAYVFIDTIFINELLVQEGLARVYFFPDNSATDYDDRLCHAQQLALGEQLGIWSVTPDEPCDRYFGNRKTKRFHRPTCRAVTQGDTLEMLRLTDRFLFLQQCYSPCRNCKP